MENQGNRLKNKIAIITGGVRGIGKAMVRCFLKESAKVLIADLHDQEGERLIDESALIYSRSQISYVHCDITDQNQIEKMVARCVQDLGEPNILINNAGKNFFNEPLVTTSETWEKCFRNNLQGAWDCAKSVLPFMIKKQDGVIINIASVHGHKIIPHSFPYPVAKHALIGMTKALGIEYAHLNIRVNSISPGLIETDAIKQWYKDSVKQGKTPDLESFKKMQADLLPAKRIGSPEEVAMLAVFLASDEARFINATDILIDGGRSALYHE